MKPTKKIFRLLGRKIEFEFYNIKLLLGGLLYEVDGFYFPFVICGGSLVAVTLFASCLLNSDEENTIDAINEATSEPTTPTKYINLLKMPRLVCYVKVYFKISNIAI